MKKREGLDLTEAFQFRDVATGETQGFASAVQSAQDRDEAVKLRVGFQLYDYGKQRYIGWTNQYFVLACADGASVKAVRECLGELFHVLGALGPSATLVHLHQVQETAVKAQQADEDQRRLRALEASMAERGVTR